MAHLQRVHALVGRRQPLRELLGPHLRLHLRLLDLHQLRVLAVRLLLCRQNLLKGEEGVVLRGRETRGTAKQGSMKAR